MSGAYHALPADEDVDVGVLLRLFDATSSSYKYLFFLALLELVREREAGAAGAPLVLGVQDVGYRALTLAWFPHVLHRLKFGRQDRVQRILDGAAAGMGKVSVRLDPATIEARLRQAVDPRQLQRFLLQVPKRLIRPFLENDLAGIPDSRIDGTIPRVSEAFFDRAIPLYRLVGETLEVHPRWRRYLSRHGSVVHGWALWHWAGYMERRNPESFGVHQRLFPPPDRESLAEQRRYWHRVIGLVPIRCPYSGRDLDRFELDHIVPWSFQPNNRLWMLVPAAPAVNANKGDRLPDLGTYLRPVATT